MFSWMLTVGVVIGLGWLALRAPAHEALRAVDDGAAVLVGCLLGSRLGYVLANWSYYQQHLAEAPQFWLGGLSGAGAALGGALALMLLAWATRQHLGALADRQLPLLVVLPAAAWLGCWQAGCAYGIETGAWWGLPSIDEWGSAARRLPVQILGAALALGIPWMLERPAVGWVRWPGGRGSADKQMNAQQTRRQSGRTASLGLLGLALAQFGLSFLRADPALLWYGLRVEAWAALVLAGLSLIGLWLTFRK